MKTLSVICPVYNEEKMVEVFYHALKEVLQSIQDKYDWNILFVMDRSTDHTALKLEKLAVLDKRVKVLMLSNRFGHQMSLVAGIDYSDSDAVIMMDSDLQHPPELIPELLKAFEQGNEVVFTIRDEPKDTSILKKMGSRNFYRLMNWLSEVKLQSGEADYRLISKRVAQVFRTSIRERNQFLRGLFNWVGYQRVGINYAPKDRMVGSSKYSWSRMYKFAFSGLTSFSKKPLQYAILFGLLFSFFGLAFTVVVLINYFMHHEVPSGWNTLSILISVFGGMQLFFMGVLGEYIGAIFDEVKGRPLYLVERSINVD